jgi:pSer/pThr/pTyr-binding forkhead associated (FHA) protein
MSKAAQGAGAMCFSCGQPIGRPDGTPAPMFPLTSAIPVERPVPPTNPYSAPERAVVTGATGEYVVRPGAEVRVGRDPQQCAIVFVEPRVSGVHATLKFEGVQLWARDEMSNNGTFVDGARTTPGEWTPVRSGAQLRFGPIEMRVRVE